VRAAARSTSQLCCRRSGNMFANISGRGVHTVCTSGDERCSRKMSEENMQLALRVTGGGLRPTSIFSSFVFFSQRRGMPTEEDYCVTVITVFHGRPNVVINCLLSDVYKKV